ncbi:MAG TPA: hypothetical protein VGP33_00865 [Chloroflexota bacterium]|nr:hypothetical protein [Chloroflexota bacterium]
MTWAERIRATWNGDIAGGDVQALLAASGSLEILRQQLADRRLSAQIDNIGEEWRVPAAVAPLTLPLWLGDSLVTLARSLCDAEAEAHPDRPTSLSAASHALAVAALRPIETIVAEASAAAADPGRPRWLTAVVMVGPRGEVAAQSLPMPIPAGYVTGLMLAAERLHGAAGLLLADLTALLKPSQPPAWLTAAIQRVKGDLAAAGARLAMLRARLNMVVPDPQHFQAGLHGDSLPPLCHDLWEVLNAALVGGQRLSDPRLLPGARETPTPRPIPVPPLQPSRPLPSASASVAPAASSPPRPAPPPAARVERALDLPDIQSLPAQSPPQRRLVNDYAPQPVKAPQPSGLPEIGGRPAKGAAAETKNRPLPDIGGRGGRKDEEARELPEIGPG